MKLCCSLLLALLAESGTQGDSCLLGKQDACFSLMTAMTDDSCAASKLRSRDHKIGSYMALLDKVGKGNYKEEKSLHRNLKRGRNSSP